MKRLVVVVMAVVALVVSLTACENKSKTAATVGDSTISESTLAQYTTSSAKAYTQTDSSTGQQYTVVPRHQALQVLIINKLFDEVFSKHGGIPTSADVLAEIDKTSTAADRDAAKKDYLQHGFTSKYFDAYVEFQGKLQLLEQRLNDDGSNSVLLAALKSLKTKVTVNPRYGSWDSANLALTERGSVPSFVTLATSAAPAA